MTFSHGGPIFNRMSIHQRRPLSAKDVESFRGSTVHAINDHSIKGYLSIDQVEISEEEKRFLERHLDVVFVIHDPSPWEEKANEAYGEVWIEQFQQAVKDHVITVFDDITDA